MNDLISVIVPVYNVEKYLRQCLESIINQTYKNLEIILVDDGSTDNSGNICEEYAPKDNRIKVIHKTNSGLSSARNAGLDICTGEYIGFVDSDDWLEPDMYEILHDKMIEDQADIVNCGFYREYKEHREKFAVLEKCVYSGYDVIEQSYSSPYVCYAVWFKLYRRQCFDKVRFPVGKNYEDLAIFFPTFEKARKVLVIPEALYHYRQRSTGIMLSFFNKKQLDIINICKEQLDYVKNNYPKAIDLAKKKINFKQVVCFK